VAVPARGVSARHLQDGGRVRALRIERERPAGGRLPTPRDLEGR